MQKPILLYDNILEDGVLSASGTAAGYAIANITDLRTHTFWKDASFAGARNIIMSGSAASSHYADCCGIAGHNLSGNATGIETYYSTNGTTWTSAGGTTKISSEPIFFKLTTIHAERYWKIALLGCTTTPKIAVAVLGTYLEFPRPPLVGFSPFERAIKSKWARSNEGILLGNSIKYWPQEITPRWNYLPTSFFINSSGEDAGFALFWKNHGRHLKPFFFAPDPDLIYLSNFYRMADNVNFSIPLYSTAYVSDLSFTMQTVIDVSVPSC